MELAERAPDPQARSISDRPGSSTVLSFEDKHVERQSQLIMISRSTTPHFLGLSRSPTLVGRPTSPVNAPLPRCGKHAILLASVVPCVRLTGASAQPGAVRRRWNQPRTSLPGRCTALSVV